MRKKVTARDVAEHAGVSRSMVSMYLSKNPKLWISEETRKKLDASISELGYRPNRTAQVLRGGKTHVVGVVLGGISGQFASRMSEALMELLEEAGYRVFIGITKYDPARERKVLESMMNFEFDALFYTLHPDYVEDLLLRCAASCPVFITEKRPDYPFHSIGFDLEKPLGNALDFLAGRRTERVALVTNSSGYGEEEFLALNGRNNLSLCSFRSEVCRGGDERLPERVAAFRPEGLISLAGAETDAVMKRLEKKPELIDTWTFPFHRPPEEKPAGTIIQPFRDYVGTLAAALLETMRNPGGEKRELAIPAQFLERKEQEAFRAKLQADSYFQSFEHK